jgi:hypothetical protein
MNHWAYHIVSNHQSSSIIMDNHQSLSSIVDHHQSPFKKHNWQSLIIEHHKQSSIFMDCHQPSSSSDSDHHQMWRPRGNHSSGREDGIAPFYRLGHKSSCNVIILWQFNSWFFPQIAIQKTCLYLDLWRELHYHCICDTSWFPRERHQSSINTSIDHH